MQTVDLIGTPEQGFHTQNRAIWLLCSGTENSQPDFSVVGWTETVCISYCSAILSAQKPCGEVSAEVLEVYLVFLP